MENFPAGKLDRRIEVIRCTETRDEAGDVVQTWDPPAEHYHRWANKRDSSGRESSAGQQVVRDIDTTWILRWDSQSRMIAPETFRFMWRGTVYEIVGVNEGRDTRFDTLEFTCCSRPDLRGDRSRELASEQP